MATSAVEVKMFWEFSNYRVTLNTSHSSKDFFEKFFGDNG